MAWGTEEQNLAVNVIAKVESSGAYDAINMRDPITVGLMQWYGTRAAKLLNRIRKDNPSSWPSSGLVQLTSDLGNHSQDSRWWTTRYLTGGEAKALKPVLRANHDAQHQTISDDIDDYKAAAERIYMEPAKNPKAVMFFCCMYHQTPARAIRIVNSAGPKSSIDRIFAVCMNDSVFAQYRTRYTKARDMIKAGDAGDLIDLDDDDSPVGSGDKEATEDGKSDKDTDDALKQTLGSIKWLDVVGDTIHIVMTDKSKIVALPDGRQHFMLPEHELGKGEKVPDREDGNEDTPTKDDDEDVAPPSSSSGDKKRAAVLAWGKARLGKYSYTNGPARRYPEKTLSTDCSGFVKAAYAAVTGKVLGQITSSQYTQGRRITTSKVGLQAKLKVGDLIYIKWNNPRWNSPKVTDHVEMYAGNGMCIGHPGPGRGPRMLGLAPQMGNARHIWVQRHIED